MVQCSSDARGGISGKVLALVLLLLGSGYAMPAGAGFRLTPEVMAQLVQPWPPSGWATTLKLLRDEQSEPHESRLIVREGYFGQTLYRHISGTNEHWSADVLVQDRGSSGAAWRAVSTVRCPSRLYLGYRARECVRGGGAWTTKTLHYQVDRFYVIIQMSGPGETEYPSFHVGAGASMGLPLPVHPRRGPGR